MKGLVIAAVCAALLAAAVYYFAVPTATGTSITFRTAAVERGAVEIAVTSTGVVEAVDTVEVSSQLSGQIAELDADYNSEVRRGEPLARLDQQTFAAAVDEAAARLSLARAETEAARAATAGADARYRDAAADFKAKRTLGSRGTISAREVESTRMTMLSVESELRSAEAQEKVKAAAIQMAEAALRRAEIDLERVVIRSPIDGIVIKRSVELGQTVAASLQAPTLFTIAHDLAEMEVHARIDEADIGQIQVGQATRFSVDAFPGRSFEGRVIEIRKAPEVVQNVVTYTVVIAVDNSELLLLPGMTALVRIAVDARDDVLLIPNGALRYQPSSPPAVHPEAAGQRRVWRLQDGGPQAVEIRTGLSDGAVTEVIDGPLVAGGQVILGETAKAERPGLFGLRLGF